jgi:Na+/H+ antiporter NhaA
VTDEAAVEDAVVEGRPFSGTTAWTQSKLTPLRVFLSTETGSAAILLAGALAALIWVNADPHSYDKTWSTVLSIRLGSSGVTQDLRGWINSGLMTFFFFIVGLEARREFDLGELRERRRVVLPVSAGLGGMAVPVLIFLALNAGHSSTHGWGAAMSTDTAFALGLLAIVGRRIPDRVRLFLLTVSVVDDLVALVVIAVAYSEHVSMQPLILALVFFVALIVARSLRVRYGLVYALLGIATWVALFHSGIDPVVVGLAMGLMTFAYAPSRDELERATGLFRLFREQPTAELAREARAGLDASLSANDRLQQLYHPWTSYLIVPLFALANAGIQIDGKFLAKAYTSPITLGIILGYVLGKPVGVTGMAWVVTKVSRGRMVLPVGWAAAAGAGAVAGIGFTVSILIASLAFEGTELREAKLGVLTAALAASLLSWAIFRVTLSMPQPIRARALLGTADTIVDLAAPVDPDYDHIRGPRESPVTIVEYGDFECPYCGQAEPIVREFLADHGDVRYVWRHLPLHDVHPQAQLAAEAAEAAANQDRFWEMHDLLLTRQDHLKLPDLISYATELGLDVKRFKDELNRHINGSRVADDLDSASLSSVSGTPTFFINGIRHYGAYDIASLTEAVKLAKARASIAARAATPA